jgi:hypothetical protein
LLFPLLPGFLDEIAEPLLNVAIVEVVDVTDFQLEGHFVVGVAERRDLFL